MWIVLVDRLVRDPVLTTKMSQFEASTSREIIFERISSQIQPQYYYGVDIFEQQTASMTNQKGDIHIRNNVL